MPTGLIVNETSVFTQVFTNMTDYVFGSPIVTSIIMLLVVFIIMSLISIPLPVNLAILTPISLVMTAIGWLPVVAGAIIVVVLVVLAAFSMTGKIL